MISYFRTYIESGTLFTFDLVGYDSAEDFDTLFSDTAHKYILGQ